MNDEEILEEINELIKSEEGNSISVEDLMTASEIDSFGLTMVVISLDDKYGIWTPKELENLDFAILTPKIIIQKIKENYDS